MMNLIDGFLAAVTPVFGGWVFIILAVAFVLCVYLAWSLAWNYFERAALSREYKAIVEEREKEERRRVALERIMASTAKYRERVN